MITTYKTSNKWRNVSIVLCTLLFAATSCIEEKQEPMLSATAEEIFVSPEASSIPITIRSTTDWTAYTYDEWIHLSQEKGSGTTEIYLMVEELESLKERSGEVRITTTYGQEWRIKVTQLGSSQNSITISPTTVVVGAEASQGHTFSVRLQHAPTAIKAEVVSTESDWITGLTPASEATGTKSVLFTFDTQENTGAEERQATIKVSVESAHMLYEEYVTVIQNGLGAPSISTLENVYLNSNTTTHRQSVWVEGGSQTNVDYELYITSNRSGSDATTDESDATQGSNPATGSGWIRQADITDGILTITAEANTIDEVREGEILIVARRDNATTKVSVHVTQKGHLTPGLDIKNPVMTHDYQGATGVSINLNPINNSTIEDITTSYPTWLKNVGISDDYGTITYDLEQYDGLSGNFREAHINLKASNGHQNPEYYTITIRQYAPQAPSISTPSTLLSHNSEGGTNTLALNPQNGSDVTIEVFGPTEMISAADILNGSHLEYTLTPYNGSEGSFREGSITLKASNAHGNAAFYYMTIRQYAPDAAGMSTPPEMITHGADDTNGSITLNSLNGSTLSVPGTINWLTSIGITQDGSSSTWTLEYSMNPYTGFDQFREAIIPITASNSHHNEIVYYLTIRQYGPAAPEISTPLSSITVNASGTIYAEMPLNVLNGTQISNVSSTVTWINNIFYSNSQFEYAVDPYDGSQGKFREGAFVITAEKGGQTAQYYITVRQLAPNTAGISTPLSMITVNAAGVTAPGISIPLNPLNGSTIEASSVTAYTWLTASVNNNELIYTVEEYTGSDEFRDGLIVLSAKCGSGTTQTTATYYIVVRQYGSGAPAMSTPVTSITANAAGMTNGTLPLNPLNGASLSAAASSSGNWISASASDTELSYDIMPYTDNTDEVREGVITITASKNGISANYYIIVKQYPQGEASMSTPISTITASPTGASDLSIPLNPLNGSVLTAAPSANSPWITQATVTGNELRYSIEAYDGTDDFRDGLIIITATRGIKTATYYIAVRQYGSGAPAISALVPSINVNAAGILYAEMPLNPLNGSQITDVTSSASWINNIFFSNSQFEYAVDPYDGSGGAFREGIITITVGKNGENAKYYIIVRQEA